MTFDGFLTEIISVANLGKTEGWKAAARVELNDCAIGSAWTVSVTGNTNGNSVSYDADLPADNCGDALTPTFNKIGK